MLNKIKILSKFLNNHDLEYLFSELHKGFEETKEEMFSFPPS